MGERKNLWLFLYSRKNLVGSILGLLGLVFVFMVLVLGQIAVYWFIISIVPGLYLIGALATPRDKKYDLHLNQEMTAEEIRDELESLVRSIRKQVTPDILTKVESIKEMILQILPDLEDVTSSDYNIYTIRQTALSYLPETLENYINLPRAFRTIHPVKDGMTAKQLLLEQLELLELKMQEISQDLYRHDSQRLMAHGRFLEEKFAETDPWFTSGKISMQTNKEDR